MDTNLLFVNNFNRCYTYSLGIMSMEKIDLRATIERAGIGIEIGRFELSLFWGDFYIRLPNIGEVAWNSIGFFADRHTAPKKGIQHD